MKDRTETDNPLSAGVHSLWQQHHLLDYTILVDDQEFRVHKVIMAAMSDYFRAMLTAGMIDSSEDVGRIDEVGAGTVKILIDFIYTNNLAITMDNASEILTGALYLQIQAAIDKCTKFFNDNLDSKNCFYVRTLCRTYGIMDAVRAVEDYIKRNIQAIAKDDCVLFLSKNDFCYVLRVWQSSEMDLFKLILKWGKYDEKGRGQYVEDLLCSVRYSLMTPTQVSEVIDMKESCGIAKAWHHQVDKACEYHKLPLHQRVPDTSEQTRVRSTPSFVSVSGDRNLPGHFYEPLQGKYISLEDLVIRESIETIYDMIVVNNFLVLCGESAGGENWHIFDPRTLKWEVMAELGRTATASTFTHSNNHLYVIGGMDEEDENIEKYTDSIDQYNFETNEWRIFDRLPVVVEFCGGCVFDNGLYISGGIAAEADETKERIGLTRMDRLDLLNSQWEQKAPMLAPRFHHSLHVMKVLGEEVICVFDADINMNYRKSDLTVSLEYYKPETDQWFKFRFTLDKPLEVEERGMCTTGGQWMRGNTLFIGSRTPFCEPTGKASVVLTFPENGTDVSVDYVPYEEAKPDGDSVLQMVNYET